LIYQLGVGIVHGIVILPLLIVTSCRIWVTNIQKKLGAAVGIVTDRESWYKIFRAYDGCPDVSGYAELWWIPSSSSPNPNFNDYVKIGGWYKPFAKTFNSKTICTFGFRSKLQPMRAKHNMIQNTVNTLHKYHRLETRT
jgi:hypothetical protein